MKTNHENNILTKRALAHNRSSRILLVEGWDPRVQESKERLGSLGFQCVTSFSSPSSTGVDSTMIERISNRLLEQRASKGLSAAEARTTANSPLFTAAGLLALGEVDVVISGALHSTADVIKAGLWLLEKSSPHGLISSSFLMQLADGRAITYADCGVIPTPQPEQLAEIAESAARTHERLTQAEPIIAFLSFSTLGSASHGTVNAVQSAVKIFHERYPHRIADGELQFDAALLPEIATRKAPQSKVAGRANVFVFPNLDAANISYKITERLAGAHAIGPLLQGFSKPFIDLSRGCSVNDIVLSACCGVLLS